MLRLDFLKKLSTSHLVGTYFKNFTGMSECKDPLFTVPQPLAPQDPQDIFSIFSVPRDPILIKKSQNFIIFCSKCLFCRF